MNKKLNYFTTIKFLWKYIVGYKKNYLMFGMGWFFDLLLKIYTPIMFAVMIDQMVYYRNVTVFFRISLAFIIMLVCSCIVHFFTQAQYAYLEIMYTYQVKKDVFETLEDAQASILNDMKTGDIINTYMYYTSECMVFVIRNMIHTVNNIICLLFYLVYIFIIGWQFGVLMIIAVPVSVFVTTRFGKKTRAYQDRYNQDYGKYSGWLFEMLSGLRDIRLLGASRKISRDFVAQNRELIHTENKNQMVTVLSDSTIKTVNLITQLAIYGVCAYLAFAEHLTMGTLTTVLAYFAGITTKVIFFSDYYLEAQKRIASIQQVHDFMNIPTEREWKGTKELKVTRGEVRFDNVSFAYEGKNTLFQNLNLTINGGQKIALMGQSGSGKSSLAYMIIGFYSPNNGNILIDGQSIAECSLKSIRDQIGIVQQDVLLFDGTIRENLLLGNKNATEEQIYLACEKAGLIDMLNSLENGIDTVVGTEGVGLSGGQKQRIAIARIYLKNPKIIIFDEATSALDSKTEEFIQEAWKQLLQDRTAIMITHRTSTLKYCDRIITVGKGGINHDENA